MDVADIGAGKEYALIEAVEPPCGSFRSIARKHPNGITTIKVNGKGSDILSYSILVNGVQVGSCSACIKARHLSHEVNNNIASEEAGEGDKNMGNTITTADLRASNLDADGQTLYEAGLVDSNGTPLSGGLAFLQEFLFEQNKAALATKAKAILATKGVTTESTE